MIAVIIFSIIGWLFVSFLFLGATATVSESFELDGIFDVEGLTDLEQVSIVIGWCLLWPLSITVCLVAGMYMIFSGVSKIIKAKRIEFWEKEL